MNKFRDITRRAAIVGMGAGALAGASGLAAAAPLDGEAGWTSIFNGRDLSGWSFRQIGVGDVDRHWVVEVSDGAMRFLGPRYDGPFAPPVGFLTTCDRFRDFHLQLEYRWGERRYAPRQLHKRNSGLLYHLHAPPNSATPACVEFQIQESDVADAILVEMLGEQGVSLGGTPAWPAQPPGAKPVAAVPSRAGGVSRLWFRKDGLFEREGDWNQIDLIAIGDRAAHLVNGRMVNTVFGLRHADGSSPTAGHLAIAIESAELMVRNIRIRSATGAD